jgi:hypothetical protein
MRRPPIDRHALASARSDRRLLQDIHREPALGKEAKPYRGGEVARRIIGAKLHRRAAR